MIDFRLVDRGWGLEIDRAAAYGPKLVRIVCPFIKETTVQRILRHASAATQLQVLTRFNLNDFFAGVSDLSALGILLGAGAEIKGVRGLHAKVLLFDERAVIAGSANLTEAAMLRNHEFGFVSAEPSIVRRCHGYFDELWGAVDRKLTALDLEEWSKRVRGAQAVWKPGGPALPDLGEKIETGMAEESPLLGDEPEASDGAQYFVKFFGRGAERASLNDAITGFVESGGCHWACTYGRRPRNVRDGATMFMSRVTKKPNDIRIFGQAVGLRHVDGRDDASPAEIAARPWKKEWPYYVRVHSARFIRGTLGDGISLGALMQRFGHRAFTSTSRNHASGSGNVNPRKSLSQQPQIELTPAAASWLQGQLDEAYTRHGTLDLREQRYDRPPASTAFG